MILLNIIFFAILLIAYYIMAKVVSEDIKETIKQYKKESLWKLGFVNKKIASKLEDEKDTLVLFGAIAWPMYYLFKMGAVFGTDVYNLINDENYEDRIASWFV